MVGRRHHNRFGEEEEESAFISMTDMTVSILFIVLILLAFFASQLRPEVTDNVDDYARVTEDLLAVTSELETALAEIDDLSRLQVLSETNPLQEYNSDVARARMALLNGLRDQIDAELPELGVRLSPTKDALQFQGEGLFASGSSRLSRSSEAKVQRIAEIINAALPCYTLGPHSAYDETCNPNFAIIEALQIEGHTDSDGPVAANALLSSQRAATTYIAMVAHQINLNAHQNMNGQPVLSIAGYGEDRPIAENRNSAGKSANRRIDLRFIMLRPARVEHIDDIRDAFLSGAPE